MKRMQKISDVFEIATINNRYLNITGHAPKKVHALLYYKKAHFQSINKY